MGLFNDLAHKSIYFHDFMERALYTPEKGYYTNLQPKIGAHGDFITAPTLGPLFATCLAQQLKEIFSLIHSTTILEYGAGTGALAANLAQLLPDIHEYIIIEISPQMQALQRQHLQDHAPELYQKTRWCQHFPAHFNGVVIANEVLDAFPVHKFHYAKNHLQEFVVKGVEPNLTWELAAASTSLITEFNRQNLTTYLANHQPYTSELNPHIRPWMAQIAQNLSNGVVLICDYGFDRAEYFHPMRHMGTLMAHYQHQSSSDVLAHPGKADLTAHIDFTSIIEAADQFGLNLCGYTSLAGFLLNNHLLDYYSDKQAQEFNILSSPAEMGEIFKVMALSTQAIELSGFSNYDLSHKL